MDVRKFYPSISHKKLIWALARKVKDKRFLKLVYDVIETCPQGLAIGYYLCQWLANFYLEPLDNYIMRYWPQRGHGKNPPSCTFANSSIRAFAWSLVLVAIRLHSLPV